MLETREVDNKIRKALFD